MDDGSQRHRLRDSELTWRITQDAIVVLDQRRWVYLSLNGSGALLWSSLAEGATTGELIGVLRERYGIDDEAARLDADAFVAMLAERELLAA